MSDTFRWIWGLLPMFAAAGFFFWVYLVQERVETLEKRIEELEQMLEDRSGPHAG